MSELHAPSQAKIFVVGMPEAMKTQIEEVLGSLVSQLGQTMNLEGLYAVTFAWDYRQSLIEIDRGDGSVAATPTDDEHGVGIAMSVRIEREGRLRSHIVLNAQTLIAMLGAGRRAQFINTVAHECAHAELYFYYEAAFPGDLKSQQSNALDRYRQDCMLACWNEFGACWRSAVFGPANISDYEATFLSSLKTTRQAADAAIHEYRIHNDARALFGTVLPLYGHLLKYAAYHLGNLYGLNLDWKELTTTADALNGHWFAPFFNRLDAICKGIASELGQWDCSGPFDELRDLAEEILSCSGLQFIRHLDGRISFEVET